MQEFRKITVKIPQQYLDLVNQVFDIEKKASQIKEEHSINRNINKLRDLIENELFKGTGGTIGLSYHNPIGETYSDTRTDCEASIAGTSADNLEIVEVIKPIIFYSYLEEDKLMKAIVQKAVVVAKSKDTTP
jgi:hypothetical protein